MTNPEPHPTPDLKGFVKEALSIWYRHAAKECENPFHQALIHAFYNYGMIADPDPSVEPYPEINPRIDEPSDAERIANEGINAGKAWVLDKILSSNADDDLLDDARVHHGQDPSGEYYCSWDEKKVRDWLELDGEQSTVSKLIQQSEDNYWDAAFKDSVRTNELEAKIKALEDAVKRRIHEPSDNDLKWVSVSDGFPEAKPVLVYYKNRLGKGRVEKALYAPRFYLAPDEDFDGCEYSEEKDEYFCPAGWYQWSDTSETNWLIDHEITHWMKLPKGPEDEEREQKHD